MVVSAALVIAPLPAMSADTGPLPAAPAAGVKQAQGANDLLGNTPLLWLVGAGVVIGLGILVLANNNNSNGSATPVPVPTTTTTTSTGV